MIGTNDDNNESVAADATTASGAGAMVEVLKHQNNGATSLASFQLRRLLEQGDEIEETGMTRTEIEDLIQSIDKFTARVRSSSSFERGWQATHDLSERPFATL